MHRRFWLDKYASSLPVMDLTFDKPHPATTTTAAARVVTRLDAELEAALRGVAQRADTPLRNLHKLEPLLRLPDVTDNLEARLILLQRRLQEHGPHLRIEKTGRGRFRLMVERPVELAES